MFHRACFHTYDDNRNFVIQDFTWSANVIGTTVINMTYFAVNGQVHLTNLYQYHVWKRQWRRRRLWTNKLICPWWTTQCVLSWLTYTCTYSSLLEGLYELLKIDRAVTVCVQLHHYHLHNTVTKSVHKLSRVSGHLDRPTRCATTSGMKIVLFCASSFKICSL